MKLWSKETIMDCERGLCPTPQHSSDCSLCLVLLVAFGRNWCILARMVHLDKDVSLLLPHEKCLSFRNESTILLLQRGNVSPAATEICLLLQQEKSVSCCSRKRHQDEGGRRFLRIFKLDFPDAGRHVGLPYMRYSRSGKGTVVCGSD